MNSMWTRRSFLSLSAATVVAASLPAEAAPKDNFVYMGCTAHGPGDGIHVARWHAETGTLSDLRVAFAAASPGFLAISKRPGPRFLFSGHQTAPKVGGLSSFRIEASGDLHPLNTITAPNADFVHLALDHTERCLIAPNYGSGTVLSCKVGSDGRLSDFVSKIQLTGHGPIASRQTAPHAHGVAISPDNRFVLINDLGTDRIMIYKLNAATAELTPNDPPYFTAAPGSGPRHLTFHPNGRWAYSINELDSTITQMHWSAKTGALTAVSSVPTLPPGGDVVNNRAGEVVIDASGRLLYGCNRGAVEELLTFAIGSEGRLTLLGRTPLDGKEARHFTLSPDEKYLLVAKQFSDQVSIFARDRKTGTLTQTSARYSVPGASCVLFG
ncbi:lactonase family protein [Granulicella arctica]|uniref:6-phosphogluconolactonase n=1 Tax=Granulicella arctica TaxID=940613 RepID=A0A7Y9TGB4_9BACT|nr:lactonase family protein [Granulicella arctica]NYF79314.1 6-phosphogluconolactonase [Granulicella arctica]